MSLLNKRLDRINKILVDSKLKEFEKAVNLLKTKQISFNPIIQKISLSTADTSNTTNNNDNNNNKLNDESKNVNNMNTQEKHELIEQIDKIKHGDNPSIKLNLILWKEVILKCNMANYLSITNESFIFKNLPLPKLKQNKDNDGNEKIKKAKSSLKKYSYLLGKSFVDSSISISKFKDKSKRSMDNIKDNISNNLIGDINISEFNSKILKVSFNPNNTNKTYRRSSKPVDPDNVKPRPRNSRSIYLIYLINLTFPNLILVYHGTIPGVPLVPNVPLVKRLSTTTKKGGYLHKARKVSEDCGKSNTNKKLGNYSLAQQQKIKNSVIVQDRLKFELRLRYNKLNQNNIYKKKKKNADQSFSDTESEQSQIDESENDWSDD